MRIAFETERLILRQWQDKDYKPFALLNADPKVMEYFPEPLSVAESDVMADKCRELISERGWGFWALELKATREFIGFTGLHEARAELPFAPCVEIGWRLAYPFWGKGYAIEAAEAALRVGFEELKLIEIVSFTALLNQRSQAVMRRLAMSYAGEFEHPALSVDSVLRQHCLYRLLKTTWCDVLANQSN